MARIKSSKEVRAAFYAERREKIQRAQFAAKERKELETLEREINAAIQEIKSISDKNTLAELISRWEFAQLPEEVQTAATEHYLKITDSALAEKPKTTEKKPAAPKPDKEWTIAAFVFLIGTPVLIAWMAVVWSDAPKFRCSEPSLSSTPAYNLDRMECCNRPTRGQTPKEKCCIQAAPRTEEKQRIKPSVKPEAVPAMQCGLRVTGKALAVVASLGTARETRNTFPAISANASSELRGWNSDGFFF